MSAPGRDRLLGHDYDGISEYDNPLPGWWVWMFWATIAFSAAYAIYYHAGPGPSVDREYADDVRLAGAQQARRAAAVGVATDGAILAVQKDAAAMGSAREIFATRCAACHGQKGEGIIGPNLTDEYWQIGRASCRERV